MWTISLFDYVDEVEQTIVQFPTMGWHVIAPDILVAISTASGDRCQVRLKNPDGIVTMRYVNGNKIKV